MRLPAGFKDWRTTATGIVTLAAAFVAFAPELFPETAVWGLWVRKIAAFIALVSGGAFVSQTPSAAMVKQKQEERLEPIVNANALADPKKPEDSPK